MKAKEWIRTLVPLAGDLENQGESYLNEVEKLFAECRTLVDARLAPIRLESSPPRGFRTGDQVRSATDDRRVAAYREGLVKWDAVVHGVNLELGAPAPFPLFRGGLLVKDLGDLREKLEAKALSFDRARSERAVLDKVVSSLNYQDDVIFVSLFGLVDDLLNNLTLHQVVKVGDDLKELMDLMRNGQQLSQRAMALHAKLYHLRNTLRTDIEKLPASQQLAAYHLLGQRLSAA